MKTLVFLLLVLPPSWSTQRLGQKDSDLDAELELVDGGVHSHEDPYTSAARVKTSDDVDKGYIPLCYTEPTDSKYTLECGNGEFAQRWNGCIELGSQRVRCPKYHYPCNNIRPNGKEFYCSVTCKGDTFGGKRNDCIEDGQEGTESEDNAEKRLKRASPQGEYSDPVIGCIKGLNNIIVNGITLSECKSKCSAATSFACNSMDYSPKKRKCHLSTETKRSKPNDYYEPCYTDPTGSLYLERKDGCELYENCAASGRILRILEGDSVPNLSPLFFNDIASSFRVNSGCRLYMWEHSNYKGRIAYIDRNYINRNPHCIHWSWIDVISSVQCKCS